MTARMNQQQFENFTASSLYCEKCKAAMPVRERLLLVLPDREIFDYLCTGCGSSVGRREVTAGEKMMTQAMGALTPDLIVVVAYGQILPRAVLEIPRLASLNLHASLLPRWRGAAPIQAAIAAGDLETGITVMYMEEGLDTGDILLQRSAEV